MSEGINPELIEKAAQAMHADNCIDDDCDHYVNEWERDAEVALAAVLPDVIRQAKAEAWDEGAAKALREAADDLERRINEPGLILAADKYGGYHAGERARGQREADVLRSRADRIEHDGRCPHRKCPGGSLCCCLFEAHDE